MTEAQFRICAMILSNGRYDSRRIRSRGWHASDPPRALAAPSTRKQPWALHRRLIYSSSVDTYRVISAFCSSVIMKSSGCKVVDLLVKRGIRQRLAFLPADVDDTCFVRLANSDSTSWREYGGSGLKRAFNKFGAGDDNALSLVPQNTVPGANCGQHACRLAL